MTVSEGKIVDPSLKRPPIIGLVITMAIVAASVGGAILREGAGVAFIIGNTLTSATIWWAILWFGFVKRSGHKVGGRYWLMLCAAGVVAGVSVMAYQKSQIRVATAGIQSGYNDFLKGKRDISTQPVAQGEAGEIEGFMRTFMNTIANDERDYGNELSGAGFDNILTTDTVKADPDLSRSKFKVQRAREIVKKYRDLYASRIADGHAMIDKTNLSENSKAQAKVGFDKGLVENKGLSERIWELEDGIVSEIGANIDLLARTRGAWQISSNQVNFERQADLDAFNAHATKSQAMSKEEDMIRAQAQATTKAKLAKLSELGK